MNKEQIMNTEQERARAEFEVWANGRCELHLVNPAGRYSSAITQFAWEAYQAGRAALAAQAQEAAPRDSLHDCALGDSNYAAGMLLGWNLCTDGRDEDFRRIREDRLRAAASASKEAQEAAPAEVPPNGWKLVPCYRQGHQVTRTP